MCSPRSEVAMVLSYAERKVKMESSGRHELMVLYYYRPTLIRRRQPVAPHLMRPVRGTAAATGIVTVHGISRGARGCALDPASNHERGIARLPRNPAAALCELSALRERKGKAYMADERDEPPAGGAARSYHRDEPCEDDPTRDVGNGQVYPSVSHPLCSKSRERLPEPFEHDDGMAQKVRLLHGRASAQPRARAAPRPTRGASDRALNAAVRARSATSLRRWRDGPPASSRQGLSRFAHRSIRNSALSSACMRTRAFAPLTRA